MPLAYGLYLRPISLEVHTDTVYSAFEPPCISAPLALYVYCDPADAPRDVSTTIEM